MASALEHYVNNVRSLSTSGMKNILLIFNLKNQTFPKNVFCVIFKCQWMAHQN